MSRPGHRARPRGDLAGRLGLGTGDLGDLRRQFVVFQRQLLDRGAVGLHVGVGGFHGGAFGSSPLLTGVPDASPRAGQALSTGTDPVERSTGTFTLADDWMITREGVRAVVDGRANAQIIDARPLAFLKGTKKHPAASAAGTIPGAAQVVHSTWFTSPARRRVGSVDEVIRLARAAGVESGAARPTPCPCHTGHRAPPDRFATPVVACIAHGNVPPSRRVGRPNW